jgi:flagellar assembly factor FliW
MNSLDESTIVNFNEGLIGLPDFRQAALVKLPNHEPFFWLASMTDPNVRFLVVEAIEFFPDFAPPVSPAVQAQIELDIEHKPLVFATIKLAADWKETTINLRAPIFLNLRKMCGVQAVLTETGFRLDEKLPARLLEAKGK